jgi:protein-disulfide isomerase
MTRQRKIFSLAAFLVLAANLVATAQTANHPQNAPAPSRRIAVVDGKEISEAEVEAAVQNRLIALKSQEYKLKRQAVEEAIDRILLDREAARRGISVQQLTEKEIEGRIRPATEEQLRAIYESTKDKYGDKSEAEVLKQIENNLRQARINLRRSDFLKDLRSTSAVQMFLDPPRIKVNSEDTRARGPQTAPVTIVEFADFQCPFCGRTAETIKQLEQTYAGQIRVVFRDFPLDFHQNAAKAAEAASCAQDQGKFWQMHDKLFANQTNLKVADLKKYAAEIGLDPDQFSQCLDAAKYSKKWQADRDEGISYGISGTPTFFVNGRMLSGAAPFQDFALLIDEELQRAGASKASTSVSEISPATRDAQNRIPSK